MQFKTNRFREHLTDKRCVFRVYKGMAGLKLRRNTTNLFPVSQPDLPIWNSHHLLNWEVIFSQRLVMWWGVMGLYIKQFLTMDENSGFCSSCKRRKSRKKRKLQIRGMWSGKTKDSESDSPNKNNTDTHTLQNKRKFPWPNAVSMWSSYVFVKR